MWMPPARCDADHDVIIIGTLRPECRANFQYDAVSREGLHAIPNCNVHNSGLNGRRAVRLLSHCVRVHASALSTLKRLGTRLVWVNVEKYRVKKLRAFEPSAYMRVPAGCSKL